MSNINAIFGGTQINDLVKCTFSGSSSPVTASLPRCTGILLKPSGNANRRITLSSHRLVATDKTAIEALQHDLNELLIFKGNADLIVEGVTFTDATPVSVSQNIIPNTEYMSYSIAFELDEDQAIFKPALLDGRVRFGFFTAYGGTNTTFPFFDNFEAGLDVGYDMKVQPRIPYANGIRKEPVGGTESIKLDCWMVGQTSVNFIKYMSDFLMDPLGRQGTLNLNGNVYADAILTGVNSEESVASTMKYTLEFTATLAC